RRQDSRCVEGQLLWPHSVVHQAASVLPDQRRQGSQARLQAQTVLVGQTVAILVARQRPRVGQQVVPSPFWPRRLQPGLLKQVLVIVNDQAADVLGHALQLAVVGE